MIFVILASSVIGVFLLLFIVGLFLSRYVWRKIFARRYNGNPNIRYFTAEDFSGLNAEPVSFLSGENVLRGFIYFYGNGKDVENSYSRKESVAENNAVDKGGAMQETSADGGALGHARDTVKSGRRGVIVFSHGFGAGHQAYTTEIDYFARMGYKVLAFDNSACVSSDGKMLGGFDAGVRDLLSAVEFSRTHPLLKNESKILFGHSWGAFSVMNAFPQCKDVSCAVAMCGFKSGSDVIAETAFGKFLPWRWAANLVLRRKARKLFGVGAGYDAVRSLKNVDRPIYLLYGKSDKVVRFWSNGRKIIGKLKKQPFVTSEVFTYKGHNIYLTRDAEKLMNETFRHISKVARKDKSAAAELYQKLDYRAMTREDGEVMEKMLQFIRKNTL